ncbi:MAG: hypothetical protein H0T43_02465, partial [Solirubrobacterales bacterium]|nr:hypothetical protein [Solirubrobacterales bacterium]
MLYQLSYLAAAGEDIVVPWMRLADRRRDHRALPRDRGVLRAPAALVAACLALAGASLALPYEPVYDAWAWLVWGRELAGLGLDLSAGPSWKPLPVLVTTPLAAAGDAAPALWLVVARAGWLLAIVLAADLAWR